MKPLSKYLIIYLFISIIPQLVLLEDAGDAETAMGALRVINAFLFKTCFYDMFNSYFKSFQNHTDKNVQNKSALF